MFNRGNFFGSSSGGDKRAPSGNYTPYSPAPSSSGYSDSPRQRPAHNFSSPNPAMPTRAPRPQGSGQQWALRPTRSPDNSYTYGNLVAVSPLDIPPSRDGTDVLIIVNDLYVFSARPLKGFEQGMISMSDPQRTWAQVALTDVVNVKLYDIFAHGGEAYLAGMDIEVGFAGKKRTDIPYDQDDLAAAVIKVRDVKTEAAIHAY
ncbi:transport between ER and Golgi ATPase protein [Ascosphaera atra]|nr:transport between ER and Golgi ATPase protein [Ascosphaera atra]